MNIVRSTLFTFALVLAATMTFAETGEVWARTLASMEETDRWLPGETLTTVEFLNRQGETDEVLKMLTKVHQRPDGITVEMIEIERPGGLIGALMPKNAFGSDGTSGASNSASAQPKEREAEEEGGGGGELLANPFRQDVQESLSLELAGESRYFGGRRAEAYAISWVGADETAYEGTIWLADETAEPVFLEVVGDSAQANVKSLSVSVAYDRQNSTVLANHAVTLMEIQFALLLRIRMRMTLEFADYFETDGAQEYIINGAEQSP